MRYRGLTRLWTLLHGANAQLTNNMMYPLVFVWSLITLTSSNPDSWMFYNIRFTNFFDTTCVNIQPLKPLARRTLSISHNTLSIHSTQKSKSWNNQMNLFWYNLSDVIISRPQSGLRKGTLYRVYTRELNRELSTGLSTLYTKGPWSIPYYFSLH